MSWHQSIDLWHVSFVVILSLSLNESPCYNYHWVPQCYDYNMTWPCFYQTRSAWSMDQGPTRKRFAVHNFAPTVTKLCVMWEGLLIGEWFYLILDPWIRLIWFDKSRAWYDIAYSTALTEAEHKSVTKYTSGLTLTGQLSGVHCDGFRENWPRYNGTVLYITICCRFVHWHWGNRIGSANVKRR